MTICPVSHLALSLILRRALTVAQMSCAKLRVNSDVMLSSRVILELLTDQHPMPCYCLAPTTDAIDGGSHTSQ